MWIGVQAEPYLFALQRNKKPHKYDFSAGPNRRRSRDPNFKSIRFYRYLVRFWRGPASTLIAIFDLRMPGMDGFEVLRRLRTRVDFKSDLLVIVLTADTAVDLRAQCLELGANEMLFKPVAMDALGDVIVRVLASAGWGGVIE
ncbi:response regulator [Sphingomonas glacialis]|nr:response regulator [Sphingomonas glacialis]